MSTKDIDFSRVALPEDEFDAMMRRALGAPPPREEPVKPKKRGEQPETVKIRKKTVKPH